MLNLNQYGGLTGFSYMTSDDFKPQDKTDISATHN
jgi:hypothetical protein